MTEGCVSGKRMFKSKEGARRATQNLSLRIRVYLCPQCHHFHATKERFIAKDAKP